MTEGGGEIIKADSRGRVRVSRERRQSLIQEFEQSGLSAAKFAQICGIKYQTLITWIRKSRSAKSPAEKPKAITAPMEWFEAVVKPTPAGSAGDCGLMVVFPDGLRLEVRDLGQIQLATALIRALGKAC